MSELENNPELFAELITVSTPFESLDTLKTLFEQNKTICFAYNEESFRLKVWDRVNDGQIDRLHKNVDPDHFIRGTYAKTKAGKMECMYEFVNTNNLQPNKKDLYIKAVLKKLESIF